MNKHTANFQKIQAKTCGIYQIILVADGRCYVGSSRDVRERWYHHRSALDHGHHHSPRLQNAWNKYGADAFRFELLEECDVELLLEREQLWMDKLDSCLNLMKQAMRSGHSQTSATREKIRIASTGRTHGPLARAKVSAAQKGRPKSQEHRDKIAATLTAKRDACPKGHPYDEENTGWKLAASGKPTRVCKQCGRDKAEAERERKRRENVLCKVEDCPRIGSGGRGWCQAHYYRWNRYGDINAGAPIVERKKKAQ